MGQGIEGLSAAIFDLGTTGAADAGDVAVQLDDIAAAGQAVQAVYVLRDQREALDAEAVLESHQGIVSGIWSDAPQICSAGVVEPPNQLGITLKREWRRNF